MKKILLDTDFMEEIYSGCSVCGGGALPVVIYGFGKVGGRTYITVFHPECFMRVNDPMEWSTFKGRPDPPWPPMAYPEREHYLSDGLS
jgi:hypothetical protein